MKKKLAIIILGAVCVVGLTYGYFVWKAYDEVNNFQPEGLCGQSITRARHNLTGITNQFSSTCIPDGWTAED